LLGTCAAPAITTSPAAEAEIQNSFTHFICSFLAHIDNHVSLPDIKAKLSENISRNYFLGAGLVVKCPHAPTEQPCNFDPFNAKKFCAAHQEISENPCTCSCGSINCKSNSEDAGLDEPASLSASSTDGGAASAASPFDNDDFSVFKATVESENSFLSADLPCDPNSPFSKCSGRSYTRSSICAGGGDVVISRKVKSFAATQPYSKTSPLHEYEYEEFALVDSGANRHFFGDGPR
jgi:hypothetical protein